jgi:hypothetical protein
LGIETRWSLMTVAAAVASEGKAVGARTRGVPSGACTLR